MYWGVGGGLYEGCLPGESGEGMCVVKRDRGTKSQGKRADIGNCGLAFSKRFGKLGKMAGKTDYHAEVKYRFCELCDV